MSLITLPPNYKSDTVKHINSITHEGKVLVLATDSAGRVWYAVKQDGFEDSNIKQNTTLSGWENLKELPFLKQNDDPSVVNRQSAENILRPAHLASRASPLPDFRRDERCRGPCIRQRCRSPRRQER